MNLNLQEEKKKGVVNMEKAKFSLGKTPSNHSPN